MPSHPSPSPTSFSYAYEEMNGCTIKRALMLNFPAKHKQAKTWRTLAAELPSLSCAAYFQSWPPLAQTARFQRPLLPSVCSPRLFLPVRVAPLHFVRGSDQGRRRLFETPPSSRICTAICEWRYEETRDCKILKMGA